MTDNSSDQKYLLLEKRNSLNKIAHSFTAGSKEPDQEQNYSQIVERADAEFNKVKGIYERLDKLEISESHFIEDEAIGIEAEISLLAKQALGNINSAISKINLEKSVIKDQLDLLTEAKNIRGYKPVVHIRPIYFVRTS